MSRAGHAELMRVVRGFRDLARAWHDDPPGPMGAHDGVAALTLALHGWNFALWHIEDGVRRPGAPDHEVASGKRAIDVLNAKRNGTVEELDAALLADLPARRPNALLHTDTPAMIVDRVSVLELRLLHAECASWPAERLAILHEQQRDLVSGLQSYLDRLHAGEAAFKVYRQFKTEGSGAGSPCSASPGDLQVAVTLR